MTKKIAFLLALGMMSGCGSSNGGSPEPDTPQVPEEPNAPPPIADNVEVIRCPESSGNSVYEDGFTLLINDGHEFRERYMASLPDEQDPPPEIDFENKSVLAVHAGSRSTGSQRVIITRVDQDSEVLAIEYTITRPCDGDTADITYPVCFVAIEEYEGGVSFSEADEFCTD